MTECEICNWALLKLGQRPIANLDEGSIKAKYCKFLLSPIHRSLLRSFAWGFATKSSFLSSLVSEDQGRIRYPLPKKCLKVLKIDRDGILDGDCIVVRTQPSDPLTIKYIEEVSLADCDPLYQETLSLKLASELCPTLTADSQLTLRLKGESEELKKSAIDMDGIEIVEEREY
ncbi:hypothetical protein AP064_05060 [Candidatus Liberibacter solanacearum]|uniref:hypothetical protein n=1 Tax=Candidatus Liberibacter solanacearum TaxID=556287 RepID=UPI0006DC44DD|nr:hypothetical protein [Candidatus Liberibacter solanacearum]KQC48730.1 hypothetical protein AP064_05060 [Candidatus Liberibacter solanacearum]